MSLSGRFLCLCQTSRLAQFFFHALTFPFVLSSLSQADESGPLFLNKPVNVSCRGISDFDFAFEFGEMISDWCRKQNELLGEQGCGIGSEMCLEEFIRADRLGNRLYFGIGASYVHATGHVSGKDVVVGDPVWLPQRGFLSSGGTFSINSDSSFDRLQLMLSVGVEFPLGSRRTLRKTCVNPYSSDYVSMVTQQILNSNKAIQDFLNACSF